MDPKTTWGAGDYPSMAEALEPVSELAVTVANVVAGERVLDVATGTGNAALRAAARGAEVIAVDFEPSLLVVATPRAREAGLTVSCLEADLEALPVNDGWADVAVSVFGSMYGSNHDVVAAELTRAVRRSGRIVVAAWIPDSFMPSMGAVLGPYLPTPPPATGPPTDWGKVDAIGRLLAGAGAEVDRNSVHDVELGFADAASATEFLIRTAGHIVAHQQALVDAGRWQALREDLTAFVERRALRGDGQLRVALSYLLTVAHRGGTTPPKDAG
jgi:SAM-dependent methyltransferase